MGVASLPMYDLPEVRPALDALWGALARNLGREGVAGVPETLVHDRPLHDLWSDPELLLSQCCGYDVVHRFATSLRVVATPRYSARGCAGCTYSSVVVVRAESPVRRVAELRGTRCVINGPESHSGMNALRALIAPHSENGRFFAEVNISGAHADSLAMLARGDADVAAIDCVVYALLELHRPAALAGLRALCRTGAAPAVPYVTRADMADAVVGRMRAALAATFEEPEIEAARGDLVLAGLEVLPGAAYDGIAETEALAAGHGYPELR